MWTSTQRYITNAAGVLPAVALVAAGWYDPDITGGFAVFVLQAVLVIHAGWRVAASTMPRARASELLLSTLIVSSGLVVMTVLVVGVCGVLRLWAVLLVHGAAWFVIRHLFRPVPEVRSRVWRRLFPAREHRLAVWARLACLFAVVAAGALGVFEPQARYDAIGYHLTTAATWLRESTVRLVPTPFGDNGQAYMPANVELIQVWLMLPFQSDTLARAAQFPFLGMMMLAAYVLARNLCGKRRWALCAPLTLLLCRHLLVQSGSGMVDVTVAAFVLGGLALAATFGRTGNVCALCCAGSSLGLAVGSKSLVLAMLPVVIPLVGVWARPAVRPRAMRAVVLFALGAVLLGGYWYARNLYLTGNPFYPLRVSLAGVTLLPGAYTREMMQHWLFNRSSRPDVTSAVLEVFSPLVGKPITGPGLSAFVAWTVLWSAGLFSCLVLKRRSAVGAVCLFLAIPALLAIQWFGVPYQESRFFFVSFGLLGVGLSVLTSMNRPLRILTGVVLTAHLLICARWYGVLMVLLVPAAAGTFLAPHLRRAAAHKLFWGVGSVVILWVLMVFGGPERTRPKSFAHHARFAAAWKWSDEHIKGARVGYAGHNIPFYLFGPTLQNDVMPVNVDEHAHFAFHDYAQLDNEMTRSEAVSPEAAYYRATLNHRAWVENILRLRLDYVVITTVAENQMLTIRHDEDGFPIEARWAAETPGFLPLVYEDPHTRIHRVVSERRPDTFEPPITRAEPDCFLLRRSDPPRYQHLYPWAEKKIRQTPTLKALLDWIDRTSPLKPKGTGHKVE